MEDNPRDAARQALRSWRRRSDGVASDRNPLVRSAVKEAGMSIEEVHVITGLGRTTIDRILKAGDASRSENGTEP